MYEKVAFAWMSNGKYSTLMSQEDLKMPWDSHLTSPLALTITFVLITAVL
jgi:hypothetical protein